MRLACRDQCRREAVKKRRSRRTRTSQLGFISVQVPSVDHVDTNGSSGRAKTTKDLVGHRGCSNAAIVPHLSSHPRPRPQGCRLALAQLARTCTINSSCTDSCRRVPHHSTATQVDRNRPLLRSSRLLAEGAEAGLGVERTMDRSDRTAAARLARLR